MSPATGSGRASGRAAAIITISDGVAAGVREDESGRRLEARLREVGFVTTRAVVPDERAAIGDAIATAAEQCTLVVTTGGTGLTPRDVTPQATAAVLDFEVPGLAEAMRAEGRAHTPLASLSRGVVGVRGRCLVVNVPGSPKGALESLEAIVPVLDHALETLAGPFDHSASAG
ncbi:MAG TPA: MogA/MoaB family molybdenum cofactor biosynthesis protein [Candidatus Limnocylindrales bacterium]